MRYTVRTSIIDVLGTMWMPAAPASMRLTLSRYDLDNIKAEDEDGQITRDAVEQWLTMHSGDFSAVIDFRASIEDGDTTIDLPWSSEDNECAYLDTLGNDD